MRIPGLLFFPLILLVTYQASGQCRIINDKYASVYITFENLGKVSVNGETKPGVILRLKNNSNCAVTVSAEIDGDLDLRRNPVIPDVLFRYRAGDESYASTTGDAFRIIGIRGGRSILFGVPLDYFDEPNGWIEVPFGYKWEEDDRKDGSTASTNHNIVFSISWLPKDTLTSIKRRTP